MMQQPPKATRVGRDSLHIVPRPAAMRGYHALPQLGAVYHKEVNDRDAVAVVSSRAKRRAEEPRHRTPSPISGALEGSSEALASAKEKPSRGTSDQFETPGWNRLLAEKG